MAGSGLKRSIATVASLLPGVGSISFLVVIVIWLEKEWRAGRAFTPYRNGEGHVVSLAYVLIFVVCLNVALLLGLVWRWWDHRREEHLVAEIRERSRGKTHAPQ